MEPATSWWDDIIQRNLQRLTQCTVITPEIVTCLFQNQLIASSENGDLTNSSKSPIERATLLYGIARRWDEEGFAKFKTALEMCGNAITFKILNEAHIKHLQRMLNERLHLRNDGRMISQDHVEKADEANAAGLPASQTQKPLFRCDISDLEKTQSVMRGKLGQAEIKQEETSAHLTRIGSDVEVLKLKSGEADAKLLETKTKQEEFGQDINHLKQSNEVCVGRLNVVEQKVETTMSGKNREWEQGGLIPFKVHKAMGLWYLIEGFTRHGRFTPTTKCEEEVFALTGNTIQSTRRFQPINSRIIEEFKSTYTVNNSSPHYWTSPDKSNTNRRWMKTDYDNWGVFLKCEYQDISASDVLYIISKQRTPNATTLNKLNDLRNFAEERGFPKSSGCPIEQSP